MQRIVHTNAADHPITIEDFHTISESISVPSGLFYGADRFLLMLAGFAAFVIIYCVFSAKGFGLATLVSVLAVAVAAPFVLRLLRQMAKRDPYMRQVYIDYLSLVGVFRNQTYFPAKSGLRAPAPHQGKNWRIEEA